MTQQTLVFSGTIQDRFEAYHAAHPEVYAHLLHLALELRGKGWRHYGIRPLCERVRWHFQVDRAMGDFKLNDHFLSRYGRKLMDENPELAGFFEIRELRAS